MNVIVVVTEAAASGAGTAMAISEVIRRWRRRRAERRKG